MLSTSSAASLRSTDSSVSSFSDTSADGNFYDRESVEDRSTSVSSSSSSNGHMDTSRLPITQNGFHESGNTTNGEVSNVDRFIKTAEPAEVHQEADNNVGRVRSYVHEDPETSSLSSDDVDAEFWLPPESEDLVDDVIGSVANCDDDDDDDGNWATSSSLSGFGEESGGSYNFKEDKIKAMNEVRNGKFKALVSQLIKSVGVDSSKNHDENWVDIVTNLSWEAASFVKPDAQEGKAMDPDGYVKVKCIATGSRTQSQVIKGLVFKKHAAHKHMQTKYKNPRLLLIQGALDLSSGGLSSFQSMHQEKDNLKSIVEMIGTYHPNVILVEKSVSRDIQESILAKGITLVFDMKLHRLERVARCIGTPISSVELATGQKLRQCDSFHIEKFVEELTPQEGGKKQSKTLMFLEGAPTRRGCTILLMGADSIELKRIKCVVRCAVVMAHHLMLETSFLLDQSAMFSSISPGEVVDLVLTNQQLAPVTADEVPLNKESDAEPYSSSTSNIPISNGFHETGPEHLISPFDESSLSFEPYNAATFPGFSLSTSIQKVMNESFPLLPELQSVSGSDDTVENAIQISSDDQLKVKSEGENLLNNDQVDKREFSDTRDNSDSAEDEIHCKDQAKQLEFPDARDNSDSAEEEIQSKDKISSVLDSESILVLMSSRNVTRGTICEQRHFSHIKFYRSFDVPLGKFLREDILNQRLQCKNCAEPPEAHIYYYAHHNKQLTVRVRRIPAVKSLPGDSDGKLWMWSRCGLCKLHSGTSKTTKRVLISSAAGGLSFGKFLELSFSNNSSFKGSSSCGHSFHKDFLYFFGLGPMVAMFKYSPVSTYSVALPPQMMEFKSAVKGDFLKKDYENVHKKAISMFLDIEKSLKDIGTRYVGVILNIHGSSKEFSDIMEILEKEKLQFELDIQNAIKNRSEAFAVCNLLRLNRVRLELLLESCLWDRRLHALLSSDLKVIETDPVDVQAQECHSKEDDVAGEESCVVDVTFENCDCGAESTRGCETKLGDSSVEQNELSVEEIPIDGQVEEFDEHNPMSLVSDDIVNPSMSESNENGPVHHSGDAEEMVRLDITDSSAELQMEKVVPIATDTESIESTSNHFLTNKRQLSFSSDRESDKGWIWAPFSDIQRDYMEELQRGYLPKLGSFSSYPVESVAKKLISEEGSRLHIPLGISDYIVSDYEDEFSSIIACALTLLKEESNAPEDLVEDARRERLLDPKLSGSSNNLTQALSLNAPRWASFGSFETDSIYSPSSLEDSHSSSFDGLDLLDSLVSYGASHPEVSMGLSKHSGKRKYSVICLYASQFRELRDRCCPSELDYIASLSRCKNWDAKGGKSKSFFAKTLDDRFIIKEIKRTEFDSFMKFAPNYFDYMNECYELGNQTCLAKILGIYQVVIRATKNGKESRHDLLVMENLSFGRYIARQYDLKGALHARFSSSGNASGDVLLDQNFVNDMNVSPLYVSRKSKRHLQRAVYNDTNFLNSINVMDYSLLVGVDTKRQELVCGIIDYLRQYTWDKQLENWVKSSLVVPKNQLPTIVSPKEYKKRFRKFIDTHFLSVPDLWCSQRSSNPCKLCGPSDQGSDSSHRKVHPSEEHDTASLKTSHHGKENGLLL